MSSNIQYETFIKFEFNKENGKITSVEINNGIFSSSRPFYDVHCALFSTISTNENLCSVYLTNEKLFPTTGPALKYIFVFREKDTNDEKEKKIINECRVLAYAYLMFSGIPIIIQSPEESLLPSYFVDVSRAPLQRFPGLARIVYPENIENLDLIFNSNKKFYYKVGNSFAKAMGGLSPITNEYRVAFFNTIDFNSLHQHPKDNSKIPGYANLCTKDNIESFIKYISGDKENIFVNPSQRLYKDKILCYYATSYIDIGLPNESMIAASASSNSLFLTPSHGEVRCVSKKNYNYYVHSVLRFLFRSKNYEDPYQNMLSFTAAFTASTNIVIPFTAPCYDVIKMLSLFIEYCEEKEITAPKEGYRKNIIFFIDLPPNKKESIRFAAQCQFNNIIKTISQMGIFGEEKNEFIFKLCYSLQDLVEYLAKTENEDLKFLYDGGDEARRQRIVKSEDIKKGLELFFD